MMLEKHLEKICKECGKPFQTASKKAKQCPSCRKDQQAIWFQMRMLRSEFADHATVNPEDAERIIQEMQEEEGKDFVDWSLDGLPAMLLKKEVSK